MILALAHRTAHHRYNNSPGNTASPVPTRFPNDYPEPAYIDPDFLLPISSRLWTKNKCRKINKLRGYFLWWAIQTRVIGAFLGHHTLKCERFWCFFCRKTKKNSHFLSKMTVFSCGQHVADHSLTGNFAKILCRFGNIFLVNSGVQSVNRASKDVLLAGFVRLHKPPQPIL